MSPFICKIALTAGLSLTANALACDPLNFDSLSPGTVVTTQYPGVVFSATAQTCPGLTRCVVAVPRSGASSSSLNCLSIAAGCPDFSPEGIRMVFTRPQSEIRLNIGTYTDGAIVTVRGYSATNSLVSNTNYSFPTGGSVSRSIRVVPFGGPIVRLEVQSNSDDFEYIDDLDYDLDSTAPIASLTSPSDFSCFCPGSSFIGTATDPESDVSWFLRVRAANSSTFATISSGVSSVNNATLATWTPNIATYPEGYYVVTLNVTNRCDLSTTTERVIYLNRSASIPDVRIPQTGDVVGGSVCFDGTVADLCPASPFFYVEYAPGASSAFVPVNAAQPSYTQQFSNDPFATWNTLGPVIPDGNYRIRIRTTDACSNTFSVIRDVVVDNTSPIAAISSPLACDNVEGVVQITGTASDANLQNWVLEFTGGDATTWVNIASGTSNITSGTLGFWNVAGLRPCAYTIRLTVADRARLGCAGGPHVTVYTRSVNVGCPADFNKDGVNDFFDYLDFVDQFSVGC